jgi:putative acetyltransferase
MRITRETASLEAAIRALLLEAFPTALEADLVDRLRRDGDIAIALVAVEGDEVVGYVAFSPLSAPMKALGLGPLAVAPRAQRRGIGSRLVREGLEQARAEGWHASFVLGDPDFYGRFGYSPHAACEFETAYAGPHFMALALSGPRLAITRGRIDYARAFRDLA